MGLNGGGAKCRRLQGLARNGVGVGIFAVKFQRAKGLTSNAGTRDHVGQLVGDIQIAATVVAQVQHQVGDVLIFQGSHRVDQPLLCRQNMPVEQKITHLPRIRVDNTCYGYRVFADLG